MSRAQWRVPVGLAVYWVLPCNEEPRLIPQTIPNFISKRTRWNIFEVVYTTAKKRIVTKVDKFKVPINWVNWFGTNKMAIWYEAIKEKIKWVGPGKKVFRLFCTNVCHVEDCKLFKNYCVTRVPWRHMSCMWSCVWWCLGWGWVKVEVEPFARPFGSTFKPFQPPVARVHPRHLLLSP